MNSSVKSLIKEERIEQRQMLGYDYGFVVGFIQGNLNAHWFNEYIVKKTDLYKGFMINKAILNYLEFDNLTAVRVNAMYEHLLKKDVNLSDFDFNLSKKEMNQYNLDETEEALEKNHPDHPVITYLENRLKEQLIEVIEMKAPAYLEDIDSFFEQEHIDSFIQSYEKQVRDE